MHAPFSILLTAAGYGRRLGLGPKAFLRLNGITLIQRSIDLLRTLGGELIVAVPREHLDSMQQLRGEDVIIVQGGESRQRSIEIMLTHASTERLLIHDVARPLATRELFERVLEAGNQADAVVPCVSSPVSVARVSGGRIIGAEEADSVRLPQSPQFFRKELLARVLQHAKNESVECRSLWELVLRFDDGEIQLVEGEEPNLKVTTKPDWQFVKYLVESPGIA